MKRLSLLFLLVTVFQTSAQTCCSGGIPLSNSIGLEILDKGSFQVGVNYDYNFLNTLNAGTEKLDDNARFRTTHSALINLGYAITNNISVEGLLTWVNQRRKITQFSTTLDQTSGVGDAIVLVKYRFSKLLGNNNLSAGIGAKLPLGATSRTDEQGITYNADLQPGSNAFDMIYLLQYSRFTGFRPSMSIGSRIIYRTTGSNNDYLGDTSYKFGNDLQALVSISDQFLIKKTLINPSLSIKYRNAQFDKISDADLINTGGDWVFIIPNFSVALNSNIEFLAKAELPVYSNVNGTQLTPTYRLTTGILFSFTPKQFVNN